MLKTPAFSKQTAVTFCVI